MRWQWLANVKYQRDNGSKQNRYRNELHLSIKKKKEEKCSLQSNNNKNLEGRILELWQPARATHTFSWWLTQGRSMPGMRHSGSRFTHSATNSQGSRARHSPSPHFLIKLEIPHTKKKLDKTKQKQNLSNPIFYGFIGSAWVTQRNENPFQMSTIVCKWVSHCDVERETWRPSVKKQNRKKKRKLTKKKKKKWRRTDELISVVEILA